MSSTGTDEGVGMTAAPRAAMTTTPAPSITTEQLVTALTATWRAIQQHHPEVPDVMLTLGSGTLGKRGATFGHFAAGRWRTTDSDGAGDGLHELFVSGEGLRRSPAAVLGTLLHEAAHALAAGREISDTSRQGRYHNKRFQALAEELGLEVTEDASRGWSSTTLAPSTGERYADALRELEAAMSVYRVGEQAGGAGKPASRNLLVAECACPRKIRVARATLELAPITCGECDEEFTAPDDFEADTE